MALLYIHVHINNFHPVLVLRTIKQVVKGKVKKAVRINYFIVFNNFSTISIHTLVDYKYIYSSQRGIFVAIFLSFDVKYAFYLQTNKLVEGRVSCNRIAENILFLKQQCQEGNNVYVCISALRLSPITLKGMKDILNENWSNHLFDWE